MLSPSEEKRLRALALAQYDQSSAIVRDEFAKYGSDRLALILFGLAQCKGPADTLEALTTAPDRLKMLFAMLVIQSLSAELAERIGLVAKDGENADESTD